MPTEVYKRDVEYGSRFKRDFKRERKGQHRRTIGADLLAAVRLLADDLPLPASMVDHPLTGDWKGHRDCHLKPDLVLIYRKVDPRSVKPPNEPKRPQLLLVRLGSHSELGF